MFIEIVEYSTANQCFIPITNIAYIEDNHPYSEWDNQKNHAVIKARVVMIKLKNGCSFLCKDRYEDIKRFIRETINQMDLISLRRDL